MEQVRNCDTSISKNKENEKRKREKERERGEKERKNARQKPAVLTGKACDDESKADAISAYAWDDETWNYN